MKSRVFSNHRLSYSEFFMQRKGKKIELNYSLLISNFFLQLLIIRKKSKEKPDVEHQ